MHHCLREGRLGRVRKCAVQVDIPNGVRRLNNGLLCFASRLRSLETIYQEQRDVERRGWETAEAFGRGKLRLHLPLARMPRDGLFCLVLGKSVLQEGSVPSCAA